VRELRAGGLVTEILSLVRHRSSLPGPTASLQQVSIAVRSRSLLLLGRTQAQSVGWVAYRWNVAPSKWHSGFVPIRLADA
jgi:hypothetical protein